MAKICISSSSVGIDADARRAHRRHRRRKSRSARAFNHVLRLSGAWLMDQQDRYADMAR